MTGPTSRWPAVTGLWPGAAESEDEWRLGGPQTFLSAAVLATVAMMFGISEMRVGY